MAPRVRALVQILSPKWDTAGKKLIFSKKLFPYLHVYIFMPKKMLIDAAHAEETRVVVVDGNRVEEFDFESETRRQLAGNIYLAKVTRVEQSAGCFC